MVNAVFSWVIANLFITSPASVLPVMLQIPIAVWFGYSVIRPGRSMLLPSLVALVVIYGAAILTTRLEFLQIDFVGWLGGPDATDALLGLDAVGGAFLLWIVILLAYVYFASVLPVWKLLQPRDYINAQQLVFGLLVLYGGLLVLRPPVTAPIYNGAADISWFPLLFITIACGAISGFHGLVASGTSSKQLDKETDARAIGYLGAVGEGTLALIAIIAVATVFGSQAEFLQSYSSFAAAGAQGVNHFVAGAARLAGGLGIPEDLAGTLVALIIVCFALTSLDSAVRLMRYIIGELGVEYGAPVLARRHVATGTAVGLTALLVLLPDGGRGFGSGGYLLWPLFGTSNQLLAGITLMLISLWLYRLQRNPLPTLIPMLFLLAMTIWALSEQLIFEWSGLGATDTKWLLLVLGAVIMSCALWILLEAVRLFTNRSALPATVAQSGDSGGGA
jgi:carbon starvation protein